MPTERSASYAARLISQLQPFVKDRNLRGANMHRLARTDSRAFEAMSRDIQRDAKATANDPCIGSFTTPGALREVKETDASGRTWTTFKGPSPMSGWMQTFCYPSAHCLTG